MKKTIRRVFALLLAGTVLLAAGAPVSAAGSYTVRSPYEGVQWGTTKVYKGNLHCHSTYSDADVTLTETVLEHYEQGFDFLAMADHGTTGVEWNRKPDMAALYVYQKLLGNKQEHLSDEQFAGITSGTYPLKSTGAARGTGLTCVVGANELNGLTASKGHVNGFFLPEGTCNSNYGYENGFEYAVRLADRHGGLSHINHPGDWLESNHNISAVYDKDNLMLFRNIFLEYDSCLGIEVFNENNNTTPYDRILWDNLLMETLPYGRTVIGFANSDTHRLSTVDSSFSMFMMEANTVENIKKAMQTGSFFCVTRKVHPNDVIGPAEGYDVIDKRLPIPMFTELTVDGHNIYASAENCSSLQWIANGKVIFKKAVTSPAERIVLNLDSIEGSEDFMYIRCELYGEGGLCASQALVIDDGTPPLKYEKDMSLEGIIGRIVFALKSTRLFVYIQEIIRAVK